MSRIYLEMFIHYAKYVVTIKISYHTWNFYSTCKYISVNSIEELELCLIAHTEEKSFWASLSDSVNAESVLVQVLV